MNHEISPRSGPRPRTRRGLPHQQLDQQPPDETIRRQLVARVFAFPAVTEAPSGISVPGARALVLTDLASGPPEAFLVGREFAHLHPPPDQSLHLTLPPGRAQAVVAAGWAEFHPLVDEGRLPPTVVMVYAPRDDAELEAVTSLVWEAYRFASAGWRAADEGDR